MGDYEMPRKREKAEEIVTKLRQVDVLPAQGRRVALATRAFTGPFVRVLASRPIALSSM
jgi:hypothetical protein